MKNFEFYSTFTDPFVLTLTYPLVLVLTDPSEDFAAEIVIEPLVTDSWVEENLIEPYPSELLGIFGWRHLSMKPWISVIFPERVEGMES